MQSENTNKNTNTNTNTNTNSKTNTNTNTNTNTKGTLREGSHLETTMPYLLFGQGRQLLKRAFTKVKILN